MSFLFRYLRFHDIIGGIHVPVDDGVDKLNRKYTLLVFLFLALPIFTKQYIGDPIECFAPVYFAEHQSRYINSYCWTQSTYYMVPVGDPDDDGDQQEPPDRIMPDEVDYFIGFETVTHIGNERLRRVRVSYYQWAPLILLAQGLCFYIPFLIWNSCANNAGVKLRRLLKKASDIASLPPGCQQREALLAEFVDQFHTLVTGEAGWCADLQCGGGGGGGGAGNSGGGGAGSSGNSSASGSSGASNQVANGQATRGAARAGANNPADSDHASSHHRGGGGGNRTTGAGIHEANVSPGCCLVSIPILGSLISCCLKPFSWFSVGPSKYLCCLYLLVKSGYVFNVGLQFFLLGQFLGRGYLRHGLELINRLLTSGEWWASPRFPLSTLCQVRADMSGGLRSYTCQCVLPINVFNEKIFSVVWFYMAFLLPLNVVSLLFWIYRTFETNRMSYIRLCLWRTRLVELNQIHRTVRRLSQSYLGWDGVFLLRLIEHNHGSIMATLIMSRLWEFYANQIKLQEDANQMALASSAQHTLAQTTTAAISNQYHQFLTNQPHSHQQHPPPPHNNTSNHSHHQQPPAGTQQQQHSHPIGAPGHHHGPSQLVHNASGTHQHHHPAGGGATGGAHHAHHGHQLHGGPAHFGHTPLQPTQAAGGGGLPQHPPPPAGMIGAHGHHSGQISQQPGHHPLHAANTAAAAAHHVHHGLAAAVVAAASNAPGGPHLSGAFTGPSANLLVHLQQAAQQAASQGAAANQQQQAQQQQQQQSGNVKAVAAALAASAAASTTNTNNSQQTHHHHHHNQQQQQQQTPQAKLQQQQQHAAAGSSGNSSAASGVASQISSSQPASINLQPLKQAASQQQGQTPGGPLQAASNSASSSNSANPASNSNSTNNSTQVASSQQQANNSITTSFITASTATTTSTSTSLGGPTQQALGSGPPLPPPPPAHVVAASKQFSATRAPNPQMGPLAGGGGGGGGGGGSQPAPPPHGNLFSMKVNNNQTTQPQARFPTQQGNTIKR